jgi:hypothetical protein
MERNVSWDGEKKKVSLVQVYVLVKQICHFIVLLSIAEQEVTNQPDSSNLGYAKYIENGSDSAIYRKWTGGDSTVGIG